MQTHAWDEVSDLYTFIAFIINNTFYIHQYLQSRFKIEKYASHINHLYSEKQIPVIKREFWLVKPTTLLLQQVATVT